MTSNLGAPDGGGLGGKKKPQLEISCVISILGFSMVRISKMTSVFLHKPPNPHGGGQGGGQKEPTLKILIDISILEFTKVRIS